jgi:hypothetical protein
MYAHVSEIPKRGYKAVEVEAVAIEKDPGGKYFCARVICSPEDGPLQMCSVYLREEGGGALCIADLPSKEEAFDYAAKVSQARGWQVHGSIYDLRIREVPGKGYLADPREPGPFTLDPAKAALYHAAIAKDDLFVGGAGEYGKWVAWYDAGNHAIDRAAEKEALLRRVFAAALVAMGPSVPASGSSDASRMREMLKPVLESTRSDRLVIFDDVQRGLIRETLDEDRFELTGHESDEELCDLMLAAAPAELFRQLEPELELALLQAFVSEAGAAAINTAVATSPLLSSAPMLPAIHRRLEMHGISSPFGHHFVAEDDSVPAPRG